MDNAPAKMDDKPKNMIEVINHPKSKKQLEAALPAHVSVDRFCRILTTSVQMNDKLMRANPKQLMAEASQIAALGLVTEPALGEAWLIADHKGGVQRRIGYRGLMKLAHQAGVPTIYPEVVYDNDEFKLTTGTKREIHHEPLLKGDRGKPYLYYAVAINDAGAVDFEYMTIEQINEIRDKRSDAWKAFKAGKIKSTPWDSDEDEMRKKTVIRRLLKRIEMSSDKAELLAAAFQTDNAGDFDGPALNGQDAPIALQPMDDGEPVGAGETEPGTESGVVEGKSGRAATEKIKLAFRGKEYGKTAFLRDVKQCLKAIETAEEFERLEKDIGDAGALAEGNAPKMWTEIDALLDESAAKFGDVMQDHDPNTGEIDEDDGPPAHVTDIDDQDDDMEELPLA